MNKTRERTQLIFSITTLVCAFFFTLASAAKPSKTPVQHVIIIFGENHSFDNLFGAYQPKNGETIDNLLSKGIIKNDGSPGPNFTRAAQRRGLDYPLFQRYEVETPSLSSYEYLPRPRSSLLLSLFQNKQIEKLPANLPNGPFQISKYVPYGAYTGDPTHRFFQMWQSWDGGKLDKFVWVEETIGAGSNGYTYPLNFLLSSNNGGVSMGFYNMNPYTDISGESHAGDAPYLKYLADNYALSDNYHQSIMGGTGSNFQAIITGHAAFFTDPKKLDGTTAQPYKNQVENPNPVFANNYYAQDGYAGGSYVNCSDLSQPGVAAISEQLIKQKIFDPKCVPGHYYLVNNYDMYWNQIREQPRPVGPGHYILPPQASPTIVDVLASNGVSWKYYCADRGDDASVFGFSVDGVPLTYHAYCSFCDPLTGYIQVMTTDARNRLQNYGAFKRDLENNSLPEVSFVRPFDALSGHPGSSTGDLFEQFLSMIIKRIQKTPELWESSAIFVSFDEGGGYYDSGYIQQLDFFGDGPRVPFLAVSPFVKTGFVDHTYYDHGSILKFIERNWDLPTVSKLSRDNLPNPIIDSRNPYVPQNRPAIGDLFNLFKFDAPQPKVHR